MRFTSNWQTRQQRQKRAVMRCARSLARIEDRLETLSERAADIMDEVTIAAAEVQEHMDKIATFDHKI